MINWRDGIRAMKCGLLAVFLLITVSSTSQAGPLGVVIEPIPSLIAGLITSTYNATTGAFTSTGFALTLDKGLGKQNISGSFSLTATISNQGVVNNATVRIGTIASPNALQLDPAGSVVRLYADGHAGIPVHQRQRQLREYGHLRRDDASRRHVYGTGRGLPREFPHVVHEHAEHGRDQGRRPCADPIPNPEPSTLLLVLAGAGGLYRQVRKRKQSLDGL